MSPTHSNAPDLQRLAVKLPLLVSRAAVDAFLPIFAAWRDAAPDDFAGVADHAHLGAGMAVQLIGRRFTVGVDLDPPAGLAYLRKKGLAGSAADRVRTVLAEAIDVTIRLLGEPTRPPAVVPRLDGLWIGVNDRVGWPNRDATEAALAGAFAAALDRLYGAGAWSRVREADPRERFGWWVHPSVLPASLDALRTALGG